VVVILVDMMRRGMTHLRHIGWHHWQDRLKGEAKSPRCIDGASLKTVSQDQQGKEVDRTTVINAVCVAGRQILKSIKT
jgi:hypothetical protein